MKKLHAEIIRFIEEDATCQEKVDIIEDLTREMTEDAAEYNAILSAANRLSRKPETDPSILGRIKRISNIFSEDELNEKTRLLFDVICSSDCLPA